MVYEISVSTTFSASHQLRLYDGSLEPLHGHNWQVVATVSAEKLDSIGVVMDFHELERRVHAVIGAFDNRHLNEVAPFTDTNPSAENVAEFIVKSLRLPQRVKLVSVRVHETKENWTCLKVD